MQIETPQAVAIYCRLSKEDLDENKIDKVKKKIWYVLQLRNMRQKAP